MGANELPDLTGYASNLIKHKARRLIGRYGFTRSDYEDIQQELKLHVLQRMRHFDPRRGSMTTFLNRIVENKLASVIRHRTATKRHCCRVTSLDDMRASRGDVELADFAVAESPRDLATDLTGAIDKLEPDDRRLANLLMNGTLLEAARRLGITRASARRRVAVLRELFTDAGIDEYAGETQARPRRVRVSK
jgi:RNA polymerase sigma-70 factor (ECF subfamily)